MSNVSNKNQEAPMTAENSSPEVPHPGYMGLSEAHQEMVPFNPEATHAALKLGDLATEEYLRNVPSENISQVQANLLLEEFDGQIVDDDSPSPDQGPSPHTPNSSEDAQKQTPDPEVRAAARREARIRVAAAKADARAAEMRVQREQAEVDATKAREAREAETHRLLKESIAAQQKAAEAQTEAARLAREAAAEEKRAADELQRPRREYETKVRARRADQEAILTSPDPERHVLTLLNNLGETQNNMDRLRRSIANNTFADGPYREIMGKKSQDFIDTLIDPQVLANLDRVELSEGGFDLLAHALTYGRVPDARVLSDLKKVIDSQDLVFIGTVDKPRYTVRGKSMLTFYDTSSLPEKLRSNTLSKDTVTEVLQKIQPESWKLTEAERNHYEKILQLKDFVYQPGDKLLLNRYHPRRLIKGPTTLKAAKLVDDQEGVRLSQRIKEWWKQTNQARQQPTKLLKDDPTILKAAKNDADARLELDKELRRM